MAQARRYVVMALGSRGLWSYGQYSESWSTCRGLMYACMHVCMYACMYVCMYACMHVCTCVRVYVRTHAFTYVHVHVCLSGWMDGIYVLEVSIATEGMPLCIACYVNYSSTPKLYSA